MAEPLAIDGCISCLTSNVDLLKIIAMLLQNGGGGSGGMSDGVVDPTTAPSNTSITNVYYNTATPSTWVWPAGGAAWVQVT